MKIMVEMSDQEFQEFVDWRKDKQCYERERDGMEQKYNIILKKVDWAVEPDPKKPGKYKIADQDHMSDLYEMVGEMLS